MPKLPVLKSKELVKVLKKNGFVEVRQKGSHLVMFNEVKKKIVVIPLHNKPLKKGTMYGICRQAGVDISQL